MDYKCSFCFTSSCQAGAGSASWTGAPSSGWQCLAWSCCVLSGGPLRLGASWPVSPNPLFPLVPGSCCLSVSPEPPCQSSLLTCRAGAPTCSVGIDASFSANKGGGKSFPGLISVVELGAQSVIYELACVAYMVRAGGQKAQTAWEEPQNRPKWRPCGSVLRWEAGIGTRQVMPLKPAHPGCAADGKSLPCSSASLSQIPTGEEEHHCSLCCH